MNANTTKNASVIGLVLKCGLVYVLAMSILAAGLFFAFLALMAMDSSSENYDENICEGYYDSRNFAGLCEYLGANHLVGEEFDKYNEAVEGAILKSEYLQWTEAAEQGIDGAAQRAHEILTQLQKLADSCHYEENRELFTEFLMELQS